MNIINSINIIISIFAGLLGILNYFYTFKSNVCSVFVTAQTIEAIYGDSVKVIVNLTNESGISLELKDLKLLKNGKQITDNGYIFEKAKYNYEKLHKKKYFSPIPELSSNIYLTKQGLQKSESENFYGNWLLPKNGTHITCSYWIDRDQIPDTLEITTNKRLRLFSRTKQYYIFNMTRKIES